MFAELPGVYTTFMHNEENKVCFEADRYLIHNVLGLVELPWTEMNLTKPMIR